VRDEAFELCQTGVCAVPCAQMRGCQVPGHGTWGTHLQWLFSLLPAPATRPDAMRSSTADLNRGRMSDPITLAVAWFDKSLQIHKLCPSDIRPSGALREAFGCYAVGLVFYDALFALVFFLQTGLKVDVGELVSIQLPAMVQLIDAWVFVAILSGCLRLTKCAVRLQELATVCGYSLGGLLPFVAVATARFHYSAIHSALAFQDPSLPYLSSSVSAALLAPKDASILIGVLLSVAFAIGAPLYYSWHIVRLLWRLNPRRPVIRVASGYVLAFVLHFLLVFYLLTPIMWLLIIRFGGSHAAVL